MDRIEMVDKLREKAGVSYEEAKAALEKNDWDLLDAIVSLEQEGKVKETSFSTKKEEPEKEKQNTYYEQAQQPRSDGFERFLKWCGRVLHKGNTNHIQINRHNEKQLSLPMTAFVLLLIFFPYVVIPLLIVGLFFGFHYKFVGADLGKKGINDVMDKASKAAEAMKDEFKDTDTTGAATEEDKKDE